MKLYPYQREGVDAIKSVIDSPKNGGLGRKAFLLGDDMGVGKTVQAITAAKEMGCKNILVLCPASLRFVWRDELVKWYDIASHAPHTMAPVPPQDGWNIVSTSVAHNKKHKQFRLKSWDLVIVDEAHLGGLKGYLPTEVSSTVMGWAFFGPDGIAHRSKKVLFLTGTPMPNYAKELWPMASLLRPDDWQCNDRASFRARYCNNGTGDDRAASNLDELRGKLKPYLIRRRKSVVLSELPAKTIRVIELPATNEIKRALNYETGEIEASKEAIDEIRKRMAEAKETNSIAAFKKAQRSLGEARDIAHGRLVALRNTLSVPKAAVVAEYVRLLLDGGVEKVVVGFWHKAHGNALQEELGSFGVIRLDGSTPSDDRGGLVKEFQEGTPRVFLGQIKAAGVGLTLTAATDVVMGEVDFVPGNVAQFCNRTHRPGQHNPVTIHMLCVQYSPDAVVYRSLATKMENIFQAVDGPVKDKRTVTWFGKGADPVRVGALLSYDQRQWVQRELYRLSKIDEKGKVGDGVGLSAANAKSGKRLSLLSVPTPEQYGDMVLILCKFQKQIDGGMPDSIISIVSRVLDPKPARR